MTINLISKANLINNNNFKPQFKIKIIQIFTEYSKKRKILSLTKSTKNFNNN